MKEELNEEGAKAEQEGSGRAMLVIGGTDGHDGWVRYAEGGAHTCILVLENRRFSNQKNLS